MYSICIYICKCFNVDIGKHIFIYFFALNSLPDVNLKLLNMLGLLFLKIHVQCENKSQFNAAITHTFTCGTLLYILSYLNSLMSSGVAKRQINPKL